MYVHDATVSDLARSTDVATARWVAKVLELPTAGIVLAGPAWPWAPTLVPVAPMLLAAGAVVGAAQLLRRAPRQSTRH